MGSVLSLTFSMDIFQCVSASYSGFGDTWLSSRLRAPSCCDRSEKNVDNENDKSIMVIVAG